MKSLLLAISVLLITSVASAGGNPICSSEQKRKGCYEDGRGCKKKCGWVEQPGHCETCYPDPDLGRTCIPEPCPTTWQCWTECKSYFCNCKKRRRRRVVPDIDFNQLLKQWQVEDKQILREAD